ncbi:MAG: TetR family transcriptional regulator [Paucibacter sp.]|nr:TetR family transcriptional regulator [Roseateles sp.]
MARGRAPTFDAQREEILAHAARLFAAQGFVGTSMNEVAEACELSKPTLYHYFRDKHELAMHICQGHVQALAALVEAVRAEQLAPREHLRALIERFVREYGQAQDAHRVLTEDVKFLAPEDRERLLDVERGVVAAFAQAVAAVRPELQASSLSKPLTMLLFGMINWMHTWLRADGKLSHADVAPLVADLFFGGITALQINGD